MLVFVPSWPVASSWLRVRYRSRRNGREADEAVWDAQYRAAGPVHEAMPGTLEYFPTERYCLYVSWRLMQVP